jgi:hypothetical protein
MNHAALLLSALLSLVPSFSRTPAILAARDGIVETAAIAEKYTDVPPGILLVVGMLESRWGTDRRSGGSWGAARDRRHRNIAGTPMQSARILRRGARLCGDYNASLVFFRTGRCSFNRTLVGYEPSDAVRWIRRAYDRAGLPLPDGMR